MLYLIILLSITFYSIAFILTEKNAKHFLSGYNTLSEKERKKIDIRSYIKLFKQFHIFLGSSLLTIGLLINYLLGGNFNIIFLSVYPILAYLYFIIKSKEYFKKVNQTSYKIVVGIVGVILIFIFGTFYYSLKENQIITHDNYIEITGMYGEEIQKNEIDSIYISSLPKLKIKVNGFATGTTKKGYFRTEKEEKIKLIMNTKQNNYLVIKKKNGTKVYFSAKENNEEIILKIKNLLKN